MIRLSISLKLLFALSCTSPIEVQPNILSYQELMDAHVYKSVEEGLDTPDSVYYLAFETNKLEKLPPEITQFRYLQVLDVTNNNIQKIDGEILKKTKYLQELILTRNPISDLPEEIGQLKYLNELYLDDTQIIELPKALYSLESLKHLEIGQIDVPLSQLQELKKEKPELNISLGYGIEYDTTLTQKKLYELYDQALFDMM